MRSFVKIKPSRIGDITLSWGSARMSIPDFLINFASVSFNAILENKFLAKISEFHAPNSCFGDSCGCMRVRAELNLISRYIGKVHITTAAYITNTMEIIYKVCEKGSPLMYRKLV